MKRARPLVIKVIACNTLLHILLVCIRSYQKSALRYKFQILDYNYEDTVYLHEKGCEEPWLFFEAERGLRLKSL